MSTYTGGINRDSMEIIVEKGLENNIPLETKESKLRSGGRERKINPNLSKEIVKYKEQIKDFQVYDKASLDNFALDAAKRTRTRPLRTVLKLVLVATMALAVFTAIVGTLIYTGKLDLVVQGAPVLKSTAVYMMLAGYTVFVLTSAALACVACTSEEELIQRLKDKKEEHRPDSNTEQTKLLHETMLKKKFDLSSDIEGVTSNKRSNKTRIGTELPGHEEIENLNKNDNRFPIEKLKKKKTMTKRSSVPQKIPENTLEHQNTEIFNRNSIPTSKDTPPSPKNRASNSISTEEDELPAPTLLVTDNDTTNKPNRPLSSKTTDVVQNNNTDSKDEDSN